MQGKDDRATRAEQVSFVVLDEPTRAVAQEALLDELAMTLHAMEQARDSIAPTLQRETILDRWTPLRERQHAVETALFMLEAAQTGEQVTLGVDACTFARSLRTIVFTFEADELRDYVDQPIDVVASALARLRAGRALLGLLEEARASSGARAAGANARSAVDCVA